MRFPLPAVVVTRVALGRWHSLAVDGAGRLWCWGQNKAGEAPDRNRGREGRGRHGRVNA